MTYTFNESIRVYGLFERGTGKRELGIALDSIKDYVTGRGGEIIERKDTHIEASLYNTEFLAIPGQPAHSGESVVQLRFRTSDPKVTKPVRRAFKDFRGPHGD